MFVSCPEEESQKTDQADGDDQAQPGLEAEGLQKVQVGLEGLWLPEKGFATFSAKS